ncbi:28S ribosomal protein S11 isoform 4 [Schistosoma japonicum]|uniref:28S ribosomal protein S11 isoform 4 n=1 Tax=Schistosoma japonicum TaxID=6182 RepID=Q5DCW6_SCHJA|nr:SJCHGC02467 protein [Schistosoma japonicum]KAH8877402.1 28S ribosomal protein S11, mitochondrial [Schistosoma japonicum]KAH8877403.1 28S ribosomal protein S11, mitochondrial [Schistosoma japonicum]KAH8877404.1 28S ribosomal protein S11, mitochondrial [Schistosoma japonicum]KAH8877407.1 28S ribosomal protein S11, mitochondrial [Schistosoma japonicum]
MICTKLTSGLFRDVFLRMCNQVILNSTHIPDLKGPKSLNVATESVPEPIILGHHVITEDCLTSIVENRQYYEIPILHLISRKNNLIATLTDCNGRVLNGTSCGAEGFRNARKKSTVAAQTVGISVGLKAKKLGIGAVRVILRGKGSDKLSALSGLNISGLKIVSLTDDTNVHYGHGKRPRKPRRL